MTIFEYQNESFGGRKRRRHHKSRNGCRECKRRRTKCDEMKPSCTRCVRGLHKCIYESIPQSTSERKRDRLSVPSSSCTTFSSSPTISAYSGRSPYSDTSPRSSPEFSEADGYSSPADAPEWLSDTELYHHYLRHTSRTLTHCESDQRALQIALPTLALQDKTVFHSILAVSTACLGCDMISKTPAPDIQTINNILIAGYRHYNLASEGMRKMIPSSGHLKLNNNYNLKLETLLASALILVPFATSSQQLNHWISARSTTRTNRRPLSTTPRDVIIMMRGIQTTLQALDSDGPISDFGVSLDAMATTFSSSPLPEVNINTAASISARAHVMFPVVSATSQGAFHNLQLRLDFALSYDLDGSNGFLSACSAAFETLKNIRDTAFASSKSLPSLSSHKMAEDISKPEQEALPHVASWLRSYARRSVIPLPTEPLTRFFLSFLVQVPQAYLDLVLPLLDQRLETPTSAKLHNNLELTQEQVLALDIYAHWSVLMFLVEDSWWIGNLPLVTLAGMVNRYGDNFVANLWPENGDGREQWWPGSMLNILREIRRHQ